MHSFHPEFHLPLKDAVLIQVFADHLSSVPNQSGEQPPSLLLLETFDSIHPVFQEPTPFRRKPGHWKTLNH